MARYDDTFVDRFLEPWNRCGARAAALSVRGLSGCFHHGLRPSLGPVGRTPMRRKRPFEWQWENPTSSGGRRDLVSRLFD